MKPAEFQFLIGSLEAPSLIFVVGNCEVFQFLIGSLEAELFDAERIDRIVSIPHR